eukprot:g4304.t1
MKTCVPDGVILDKIAGLWRCKYCPSRNYFSKTTDWADPKGKWNLHGVNCEYYLEMVNSPTKRKVVSLKGTAAEPVKKRTKKSDSSRYMYDVREGLQVAGICDDNGELIFGMVEQSPSKRNEKRNEKGEIIRPAATIFRPFGKRTFALGYDKRKGKEGLYIYGKLLKQARRHAEMAVLEKLEDNNKNMVTQESPSSVNMAKTCSSRKKKYTYDVIGGLQFAGICDDNGELIFGMVEQSPSKRNEKRNEKGEIIRPAATIFRPFGKRTFALGYDKRKGKEGLYIYGKLLKQARRHAEMAVLEKLEDNNKNMVTQESPSSVNMAKTCSSRKKKYTYDVIGGLQFAGICDDNGELIFGMVEQSPSKRNEKRNEKGEIIRPAATIFRPFGKRSLALGYHKCKGKEGLYVCGKLLKQARRHAEMAVLEKHERKSKARNISESPKSVQLDSGHFGNNAKSRTASIDMPFTSSKSTGKNNICMKVMKMASMFYHYLMELEPAAKF